MARQAKMVEKLLVMRNAFRKWLAKLQEKRREEKVKLFERKLVKGYFDGTCSIVHTEVCVIC